MFRIYRDVRFQKTHKNHFGIAFTGKAGTQGYYLHLGDNSFLGVGFWAPNPADLFRIRKELEFDADELKTLVAVQLLKNMGKLSGMRLIAPKA